MSREILVALVFLALSGITFSKQQIGIEERTLDQIHQAALNESCVLTVAWGADAKVFPKFITDAFHNRFPDIKLNLTGDLSKYWDSKIDRACQLSQCKDNAVDVAILQTLHNFPRWKAEGRLMPYKVASWNDIYPEFVDPDGTYTGLFVAAFGDVVYNPNQTDERSLPRTFTDFLSPIYANGQIVLTYPNDDDAILYLFSRITQKYGWDFIYSLIRQNITWTRGTATPAMLIEKSYMSSKPKDSNPGPTISFSTAAVFTPGMQDTTTDDIYMTWPQTGAIFSTTKCPETAKLFLSYLMDDDDWQKLINGSGFATRKTYDRRGVFEQEPNMDGRGYLKFANNRELVERWRFQFETLLGLPQGVNPNYIDF